MYRFTFSMIVIFFVFLFSLSGCFDDESPTQQNTVTGSGKIVTENRTAGNCTGILIESAGSVTVTRGPDQSIRVEADDNIISDVITESVNGILKVRMKQKSYSDIKVNVYVTLPEIRILEITGAGNIRSSNAFSSDSLFLTINGAGNIEINGSGDFLSCLINGAGNINAGEYITKQCVALTRGAGNCTINVTEKLNAKVEGVGSIYYYGNPEIVEAVITGIGNIVPK